MVAFGALAAGLGSGLASGLLQHSSAKDQISTQQKYNTENYKKRYQWTMDDLSKAGLNPILAAQGLTGGFPQVSPASGAHFDLGSSAKNIADVGLKQEQTKVETEKQKLTQNQAVMVLNQSDYYISEAHLKQSQVHKIRKEVQLLKETIKKEKVNIKLGQQQVQRIKLMLKELSAESRVYGDWLGKGLKAVEIFFRTLTAGILQPSKSW